jgi:hypothetical protein
VVARSAGKTRIHQTLEAAGRDIKKLVAPTDLGVPAFDDGNKAFGTNAFNNGLGLMINGVQYVYVVAQSYGDDPKAAAYCIGLKGAAVKERSPARSAGRTRSGA